MASVVTVSVIVLRLCSLLESMVRLRAFNIHRTFQCTKSYPVAQMVEHGASNAKIMGSIPRESKSWSNVKL